MKKIIQTLIALTISFAALQGWADDTEVYVSGAYEAQKPNVIMVIANSDDMERTTDQETSGWETFKGLFPFLSRGKPKRLEVGYKAISDVISETHDINLTLMHFNPNRSYNGGFSNTCLGGGLLDNCYRGGSIVLPMKPMNIAANRDALLSHLKTTNGKADSGKFSWEDRDQSPLVESVLEAYNYFAGNKVNYGMRKKPKTALGVPIAGTTKEYVKLSSSETIEGDDENARYLAPAQQQCQKNHIILFSRGVSSRDGEAQSEVRSLLNNLTDKSGVNTKCTTSYSDVGGHLNGNSCLIDLAYYMYNRDLRKDKDNTPSIQFHSLGGFLDGVTISQAQTVLNKSAAAGQGVSLYSQNYETIVRDLKAIFENIIQGSQTMASPVVPIDDMNDLKFSDEVYYALFQAANSINWKGNVKRYRITGEGILDKNNQQAIDEKGFFKQTAHSYWSAEADGERVTEGGFASILPATRNVKTNGNAKTVGGDNGDYFAAWLKSGEHKTLGDFLHTTPAAVNYKDHGRVLFVGSNSGYLHAIKTDKDNPTELSAFVPKELLPVAKQYFLGQADTAGTTKLYGLDGPISVWHDDVNDNDIVDDNEKVYLYVGMRRGGNTYYAFDVSNPSDIKLEWQFDVPGQSWSRMRPENIKWEVDGQVTHKTVLIVAGGYDAAEEDKFAVKPNNSNGSTVYILDPLAANDAQRVLWSSASNTADIRDGDQMNRSIVGDIYLARNDSDYTNLMYVADVAGRIWRFDLDFGKKTPSSNNSELLVVGAMIADLSNGTERFYNSLEVSKQERSFAYEANEDGLKVNTSPRYILSLGSGNRAFPNSDESSGQFYVVFDSNTGTINHKDNYPELIKRADLSSMSLDNPSNTIDKLYPGASGSLGYIFGLKYPNAGEKVLNKALVLDNKIYFNTYRKASVPFNEETCEPNLGESLAYIVDLKDGTHESQVLNVPGIPSPPVLLMVDDKLVVGLGGTDPSQGNGVDAPKLDFELLYWKEVNEEN